MEFNTSNKSILTIVLVFSLWLLAPLAAHAEVRTLTVEDQTFEIDFETIEDIEVALAGLANEFPDLAPLIATAAVEVFADLVDLTPGQIVQSVGGGAPSRICDVVDAVNEQIDDTIPGYPNCGDGVPERSLQGSQPGVDQPSGPARSGEPEEPTPPVDDAAPPPADTGAPSPVSPS